MGETELHKLVRSYTNGMLPLEVYREQRRHIIDRIVGLPGAESPRVEPMPYNTDPVQLEPIVKESANENDPLQALSQSQQKASVNFKFKPLLVYGGLSVILTVVLVIGLMPESDSTDSKTAEVQDSNLINSVNNQFTSKAKTLIDSFVAKNQWNDLSINQFILDWELLDQEEKYQALQTPWSKQFVQSIKSRLDQIETKPESNTPVAEEKLLISSLLATIDPSMIQMASISTPNSVPTQKPAQAEKQKPSNETTVPAAKTQQLNRKELDRVLKELSSAYEHGNLKKVMALFSDNAVTNHHNSLDEIRADYKQLFKTTRSRKIEFSDFAWSRKANSISGKGKYLARLNPLNTNVDQVFSADVAVSLQNNKKGYKITGLYLANQKFSTQLNKQVAEKPILPHILPPTNEELQLLIARFVTYYDDGDVERLMGLFSREAQTNETASLADIRKDYADLFRTTESRRINIKSLTWKTSGKLAVGSGMFEATIQPQNTKNFRTVKGKIRISATKSDQNVFITRLLHSAQ